jgi:4-alpha-glucanotransferase
MSEKHLLHRLAPLYGVQTAYYDIAGRWVESPPEAIVRVLGMLGAPLERMHDIKDALRQRRELLWQRVIEPVIVAWDGRPLKLKLRLPGRLADAAASYKVVLESAESREGQCHGVPGINAPEQCVEGQRYVTRSLLLPDRVPPGYHRLHLRVGDLALEAHFIAAPLQAYAGVDSQAKSWGLFCPLYALASKNSWGAGDFSDLESFVDFAGRFGAGAVGTLPLLAAFLDEPFNPSPYAPVSRLFWNEFYLDVERIPEFRSCPAVRSIISNGFVTQLEALRGAPLVDYRRLMTLKRRVLEALLHCLLSQSSERRADFERFIAEHPLAQDYASFRAKVERERKPWQQWPEIPRDGVLRSADYDEKNKQYHLYVQWQAHEQMGAVADKSKTGGPALYLDFPLGVNRDGYDVWREREVFALGASGGAPPDGFFIKGQNWGCPPLHPEGLRRQGYRYYAHCVRHHLRYARMLRIDHVMGLHRFYWVPQGFAAPEGVYVRYPAEEFYAVLNLESHRYGAQVVGENLGTVPPYVNAAMARHKMFGLYVGQFGVGADPQNAISSIPASAVASLNTHDTATFAGFWAASDIRDRVELGLLNEAQAATEHAYRGAQKDALVRYLRSQGRLPDGEPDALAVLKAWLCHLSASGAELVLINIEDTWLEALPQNVPGTWEERPNWRRKARHRLEAARSIPSLLDILAAVNQSRQSRR